MASIKKEQALPQARQKKSQEMGKVSQVLYMVKRGTKVSPASFRGCLSLAEFLRLLLSATCVSSGAPPDQLQKHCGVQQVIQKVCALGDKEAKGQHYQLSAAVTPSSRGRVPTVPFHRLSRESAGQTTPEHRPAQTQARALTRSIL